MVDLSLHVLAIVLLNVVVYWRTIDFGLCVDDVSWSHLVPRYGKFSWKAWYTVTKNRLYGCGTFGKNKKVDHSFAIALHTLACVLIFFAFGTNIVSFWAAILYSLNPANNQTSIWLNGRRYMINIILVLLMVIMGKWGLLLYPLTAVFQINAIFSPVIYGAPYLLVTVLAGLICWKEVKSKYDIRRKALHNADMLTFFPKKLIAVVKLYGAYVRKMLLPGRCMMNYPFLGQWGLSKDGNKNAYSLDIHFFFGLATIAATLYGLYFYYPQGDLFNWFLFMVLATAQWSGFITVTQTYADRYISLPNAFMMFFLSDLLFLYLGNYALIPIAFLIGNYYVNLRDVMQMYGNIWTFYDYHIWHDPAGTKCREFKAARLIKAHNDPMGAWEVIKRGLEFSPHDMRLNMSAAWCMDILGDKQAVVQYMRAARDNCYIGQEFLIDKFQRDLFGFDLKEEVQKIKDKKSKLNTKQRDNVLKINEVIYGNT